MKLTSRASTVVLGTAAVLAVAVPAYAAWQITATNPTANATATAIGPVTGVGSSVTSSSVTLTWVAPAGVPATGYTVTRTAPSSATVCTNVAVLTCTDTGLSGSTTYSYSVVAQRSSWTSSAVTTDATTSSAAVPSFVLTPAAGPYTAGSAFNVSIQARLGLDDDPTYTGNKTLTISAPTAPNGTSSATMTASPVAFNASGQATVSVTLFAAGSNTFTISDGTRSGSSTVTVVAGAPAKLGLTAMSIASQNVNNSNYPCILGCNVTAMGNSPSVSSKVSVVDTWGNAVSNIGTAITVNVTKSGQGTLGGTTTISIPGTGLAQSTATWTYTHTTSSYDATVTATSQSPATYTAVSARFQKN